MKELAQLKSPNARWDPVKAALEMPKTPAESSIEDLRTCGVLHELVVHHVLVETAAGEWAVMLCAFDPQSLFFNAFVLALDVPIEFAPGRKRGGRPRSLNHPEWEAAITQKGDAFEVILSAPVYQALVIDTVSKTGIPYRPIWLTTDALGAAIPDDPQRLAPGNPFALSPVSLAPSKPLASPHRLTLLCDDFQKIINLHNRIFAQGNLRRVRQTISNLIAKGLERPAITIEPDELDYDQMGSGPIEIPAYKPTSKDKSRRKCLKDFRESYRELAARGHYVALSPKRIHARLVVASDC